MRVGTLRTERPAFEQPLPPGLDTPCPPPPSAHHQGQTLVSLKPNPG